MRRKMKSDSGFTLAELLIVVAIIGVLVAIAIPIFTGQLEKSREAVDLSDVRSAYAEVMMAAITGDTSAMYTKNGSTIYDTSNNYYQIIVSPLKQQKPGWDTPLPITIGGVSSSDKVHWQGDPGAGGSCEITYWPDSDSVTFVWSGGTSGGNGNGGTSGGDGGNTGGGSDSGNTGSDSNTDNGGGNGSGDSDGTDGKTLENINGLFDAWVTPYPTGEFWGILGNLYSYNGKIYICNSDQKYNAGGSPETNFKWNFVELVPNPTILTKDNLIYPWYGSTELRLKDPQYGQWYRDGNDYYVCIAGASFLEAPNTSNIKTIDHGWGNWLKIPTTLSGNYGA